MNDDRRGTSSGSRRGQTQRIASGARAAPYSRPKTGRTTSSSSAQRNESAAVASQGSKQWPPNQLSIRGASGPTWVIIANLLLGTTEADIHETFRQFGDIEDIKLRKAPSENHPSVAFDIAFTQRSAANIAIEKLDGALADGRLLQVTMRDANKFGGSSNQIATSSVVQTPPVATASVTRELFPAILPSGPKAQQQGAQNGQIRQQQQQTRQISNIPKGPKVAVKQAPAAAPVQSLQSRMMSAAELKTLQKQQARAAAAKPKSIPGVPTGPKGTIATPATTAAIPLSKRITLPLAMRLSEEAKKNGPASSPVTTTTGKKRKNKSKGKAKNANGMELD